MYGIAQMAARSICMVMQPGRKLFTAAQHRKDRRSRTVKLSCTLVAVMMGIVFIGVPARGEEAPATPAVKPVVKPVEPPAAPKAKVLATVGKAEITEDKVNAILARYPGLKPAQLTSIRTRLVGQMVQKELMTAYLKTAPCPAEKLTTMKKKLGDQLKQRNMTLKDFLSQRGLTEADLRASVAMDTLQQIEAQLVMRHYDGFMRRGRMKGRRG